MQASVSIYGLYKMRPDIFDNIHFPRKMPLHEQSPIIPNLVAELSCFEILYADADVMKDLIGVWSEKEVIVWERLYNTTVLKYDPISNYDRTEEYTTTEDGTATRKNAGSSNSETQNNGNSTNVEKVVGYNESVPVESGNTTNSGTSTSKHNSTSGANEDETSKRTVTHRSKISGNIGVTTSQQMIEAERQVALFNLIDVIIESFKKRFCILVY